MSLWFIPIVALLMLLPILLILKIAENADARFDAAKTPEIATEDIVPHHDTKFIRDALYGALKGLQKQRAGGYGPWISSCLSRVHIAPWMDLENIDINVTPEIALRALYKTMDELSRPRFQKEGEPTIYYNLDCLTDAIRKIKEGEGA